MVSPELQALTAGFFFNAAKLQRSGNYRTIKNKQTVHMHPQNGLSEVRRKSTTSASIMSLGAVMIVAVSSMLLTTSADLLSISCSPITSCSTAPQAEVTVSPCGAGAAAMCNLQ